MGMSERTYTVNVKGGSIKVASRDLAAFRDMYIWDSDLISRMSELLWMDIYTLDAAYGVGPHDVLEPIKHLELGNLQRGLNRQHNSVPLL